MDIDKIFKESEDLYRRSKHGILADAFDLSEKKGHSAKRVVEALESVISNIYRLKPDILDKLNRITGRPSVVDYILKSIEYGVSKQSALELNFTIKQQSYVEEATGIVESSLVDPGRRLQILNEFRSMRATIEARPKPEVVYIPMTKREVDYLQQHKVVSGKRILANSHPVTYNPEAHIIAAVIGDTFKPLVSFVVDNDKYPEQIFSGEFEKWIFQMDALWVTDELKLGQVLYFIDSLTENFYMDSFMTHWHSGYGYSFAGVQKFESDFVVCPPPTEQDEFFCGNSYRLNPGDYNSPVPDPLVGNFTDFNGQQLVIEHDRNNVGFLAYNLNGSGPQTFYRVFRSTPNRPKSNAYVFLSGYSEDVTMQHILDGILQIDMKLPGLTGWMSCNKYFDRRQFDGLDGDGIMMSYGRFGPGVLELTFGKFNTGHCDREGIMRITYQDIHVPTLKRVSFINWRSLYQP